MSSRLNSKWFLPLLLILFNVLVWYFVFSRFETGNLEVNFLDVGQGDSILISLNNQNHILIDGGPDKKVLLRLSENLPPLTHYLDLVILTHPHLDHFSGLKEVLERYQVGALVLGDVGYQSQTYQEFLQVAAGQKVKIVPGVFPLALHIGDFDLDILWPEKFVESSEVSGAEGFGPKSNILNEESLVAKIYFKNLKMLLMGDATSKVETKLASRFDLESQILKVGHHGSKYSTSLVFLNRVKPQVALIEVGGRNRYGHPTSQVLYNLKQVGANIFRTDLDGTVRLVSDGDIIKIFKEK